MLAVTRSIELALRSAATQFVIALRSELKAQGHHNTGRLSNSIVFEIENELIDYVVTFFFEEYGFYIDKGVTADKIPYSGRGLGTGTKSKYIGGLIDYFKSKGLTEKEAKSAAFATANKHKKEGMPTKGSYAFSKNGRRLNFIDSAYQSVAEKIQRIILVDLLNKIKVIVDAELKINVA